MSARNGTLLAMASAIAYARSTFVGSASQSFARASKLVMAERDDWCAKVGFASWLLETRIVAMIAPLACSGHDVKSASELQAGKRGILFSRGGMASRRAITFRTAWDHRILR